MHMHTKMSVLMVQRYHGTLYSTSMMACEPLPSLVHSREGGVFEGKPAIKEKKGKKKEKRNLPTEGRNGRTMW